MEIGKSWALTWTGSTDTFSFRVNLAETYDVTTNKSKLSVTSVQIRSTNWYGFLYYPDGLLRINGVTVLNFDSVLGNSLVTVSAKNQWYSILNATNKEALTASIEIDHANDGSKTINIEVIGNRYDTFRFYTLNGSGGSGWHISGSQTIDLTTIPRASTIGATNSDIGAISTITVTPKSSAYMHSIKYQFGNISGYILADGTISSKEVKISTTNIAFRVPESFYAEIPNDPFGTCILTCTTYLGNTQIGDVQTVSFKATANMSNCAPTVFGTVIDSNEKTIALTGDPSKLIRYFSNALCTITSTAKNGASIVTEQINNVVVTNNERIIYAIENGSIIFSSTDSREYPSVFEVNKDLIPYIRLTANVQLKRTDPTSGDAVLSIRGDYFKGSFGAVSNSLTAEFRFARSGDSYGDYRSINLDIRENEYSAEVPLSNLDYEYAYTVEVVVKDKLTTLRPVATVTQGIPTFDWGSKDFRFNVPVLFPTSVYGEVLPSSGKVGQVFFQKNSGGDGFTVRIYDGSKWL